MNTQRTTKTIIITSIILLVGGTIAFAHGGWGYGGGGPHMRGDGPGWGKGGGYGDLSEEDAAKVTAAREKFHTQTKEIRRQIGNLREDLRDEMAKENPDSAEVLKMQKELSGAQADFDQQRVQHRLEMQKLVPGKFQGRGFGKGYGRGGRCWE